MNNNGNIETDLYYKPTDSKQYLLFSSCHPKHTRLNIPFSLARRICCIVSKQNTKLQRLEELKSILIKQNYPKTVIDTGIKKALMLPIPELREVKKHNTNRVIPLVTTHNPQNPELFNSIIQNLAIIHSDNHLREAFQQFRFIKSKRQSPNLRKILTRAKFEDIKTIPIISKCNRPNCGLCKHLIEGTQFEFQCGKTFIIKYNATCAVKNVIYVIRCCGCKKEYIGETGDFLRHRVTVHNQQIRDENLQHLQVSKHLANCPTTEVRYQIFPFYKLNNDNKLLRKAKEEQFINLFKPALNANG